MPRRPMPRWWWLADAESDVEHPKEHLPAWLRETGPEHRFPVAAAVALAVAAQLLLPTKYSLQPRWLLPAAEILAFVVLTAINPVRLSRESRVGRYVALVLVIVITASNVISSAMLSDDIVTGKASDDAAGLLRAGAAIYFTNVVAFGLWYWEIDRGGPFARSAGRHDRIDLLFPQMATPEVATKDWEPRFLDYAYVSFTNATAFSPTDTMPLTRGMKALMAVQSLVALVTVGLVIARAVNVLK